MNATRIRPAARGLAAVIEVAAASWATYAAVTWFRYGHPRSPRRPEESDSLLDSLMPACEVAERHRIRIAAPAEVTLSAACEMDLQQSAIISGIFRARELLFGSHPDGTPRLPGFLAQMKALGWGLLAEVPGR